MLTFETLHRHAAAFRSFTGMNPAEFEALLADVTAAAERQCRRRRTTRRGTRRRRAAGGGHPFHHDLRGRLLLTLVWLRAYPTYEILGFLFDLHKGNAQRNVGAVLEVLDTLADFPFDRPDGDPSRRPLGSVAAVMDAFPSVRLVIDTKEQRIQRPSGEFDAQKPYYSMKKKAHTLKVQLAVTPDGQVASVGASVPGGAKHDKTLLVESGLLDRLAAGEGAMMDKAYDSLREQYPDVVLVIPKPARRGHPLTDLQKMANRFIARYRIVVEHTIAQLNRYTALRQMYRGERGSHNRVVRVVARLVNRRIRVQPLKTYDCAA
jgi:hypothetical protein